MPGPLGRTKEDPPLLHRLDISCLALLLAVGMAGGCASLTKSRIDDDVIDARQLSIQGMDAMQRGRLDDAEALFNRAIEKCPADERTRKAYADTLWDLGDHDQAVANMEQAVRLSGGDPEFLVRLGDMYLARGDLERAAKQADMAIRANRKLPAAWALRGDVLNQQGRLDEGLASYHRALSYQDHFPRVQLAIADVYRRQERPARSLATLRSLGRGYPAGETPQHVLFLQGLALKDLTRYNDAVDVLKVARDRDHSSPDLLFTLAECQFLAGDPINARLSAEAALADNPQHEGSLTLLAHLNEVQSRLAARPLPDVGPAEGLRVGLLD